MRPVTSLCFSLTLLVLAATSVSAATLDYWAVDGTQKIKQTHSATNPYPDKDGTPLKTSPLNLIWKNNQVNLFGAKNEYVTFQIIAENNSSANVSNVSARLDKLVGPGGFEIKNSDNTDVFNLPGKNIFAYKTHYVNITAHSRFNPRASDYWLGLVPDPLIPNNKAVDTTPTFSIAAKQNQSAYLEVYIPKNAPAGNYSGTVIAKIGNSTDISIPVKMEVFNFALSDTSPIKNMFWIDFGEVAYRLGVANDDAMRRKYLFEAKRHSMDLVANFTPDTFKTDFQNYVNGSNYSPEKGYYGVGSNVPHTMYSIGTYDLTHEPAPYSGLSSGFAPETSTAFKTAAETWMQIFETDPKLSNTEYFKYMPDEPDDSVNKRERVATLASWVHLGLYDGKRLKTFCTSSFWVQAGACDIWSIGDFWSGNNSGDKIAAKIAAGDQVGIYNGMNPWYGQGLTDITTSATDSRILPWTLAKFPQLDHYFLWGVVIGYKNVWNAYGTAPLKTFSGVTGQPGNAHDNLEARMMYHGLDSQVPADDQGIPGPIPSMRMKDWRAGIQDIKYIQLAKSQVSETYAREQIVRALPKALYEHPDQTKVIWYPDQWPRTWSDYGYDFEKQRHEIGSLLNGTPTSPSGFDFNNDGKVNIFDWSYFTKGFGSSFGISDVVEFVKAFGR